MSASSIADIMQDKGALAAACEELAEFLLERADYIKKAAAKGGKGFDLAGSLPLMCAFQSPDHMRLMAVRLRAVVRKLDALPVNAEALDALERLEQIKHPITKEEFQSPAMRRKFLACLWALVDHWNCHQCRRASKTHTRFKDWEGVIGGVLECAAFGSAFTRPLMGMDDQSEAWRMFFVKLAGEMKSTADLFTVDECLSVARENDLLDDMLPATVGKDEGLNHAFGTYVRRRYDKGKEFKNEQGRWCVFRKANDGHKGSRYQVELKDIDTE